MHRAEKSISIIYRFSTWLSLSLIIIATIEFIFSGQDSIVSEKIDLITFFNELASGNFYAAYLLAIIILIFSPLLSLVLMFITFIIEKKWKYSLIVITLIIIMVIGAFLKAGG